MFHTHAILTKRGPLARLWLAAHWDKKLSKAQIFETDIRLSCESILEPCLKLALRTKGHLLLGVVRIYSRKTKYLLADCNEAFIKIKMAFRTGVAPNDVASNHNANQNLENREACIAAITLPDNFHDFDMIDLNLDYLDDPSRVFVHQARTEEITLKEDCISEPMLMDDDFGEVNALEEPEFFRNLQTSTRNRGQNSTIRQTNTNGHKDQSLAQPLGDDPFALDGFGDPPPSVIGMGNDQSNLSIGKDNLDHVMSPFQHDDNPSVLPLLDDPNTPAPLPTDNENRMDTDANQQELPITHGTDDTTLLSNVSDEYILPPIATEGQTAVVTRHAAAKRKRKLIIDGVKEIDNGTMKIHLNDTKDIVGVLELAPPTRRLMYLKDTGALEKLFSTTATSIYSKTLQQFMTSQMITKPLDEMMYNDYQTLFDSQIERSEHTLEESSIDFMRAAPQEYFDPMNHDPSLNLSKKRALSPAIVDDFILDKRPRLESMLPPNSSVFQPMTSIDNIIDIIPDPVSPRTSNSRVLQQLNQMSPSPTRTNSQIRRKKGTNNINKENQEDLNAEDVDDQDQTEINEENLETGKKLNRRTKHMLTEFDKKFNVNGILSFHDHISSVDSNQQKKKITAQKFYSLLVLKKLQAVDVEQEQPYGDITVKPGVRFKDYITGNVS